nr:hypothetical protein [Tanacetum cinerariifolium]
MSVRRSERQPKGQRR